MSCRFYVPVPMISFKLHYFDIKVSFYGNFFFTLLLSVLVSHPKCASFMYSTKAAIIHTYTPSVRKISDALDVQV